MLIQAQDRAGLVYKSVKVFYENRNIYIKPKRKAKLQKQE